MPISAGKRDGCVQNKSLCQDKAFQAGGHITRTPSVRFQDLQIILFYINMLYEQSKSYQHVVDKQGFPIISIFLIIAQ
jgi:hypothetical protein